MAACSWRRLPLGRADAWRKRPAGAGATRCGSFPGSQSKRVTTSGAEINLVHAGSGPPLLLMHGAPQTHVSMRLIAPELAKDYTVIVPDLRGYGDSSKPPTARTTRTIRSARWRSTRSRS